MYTREGASRSVGSVGHQHDTAQQPRRCLTAARLASTVFIALFLTSPSAVTAHGAEQDETYSAKDTFGYIGDVVFPAGCDDQPLPETFNRGVALLHHMTYEVAEQEFLKAAEALPDCALPHWGIAMALVHPLWPGEPSAETLKRGAVEIAKARALASSPLETEYIEALAAFYDDWDKVGHGARIARWDKAQTALSQRHPDDDEAVAFAALIHIATAPKDDLTYQFHREAGAWLEALRARRPMHPAASHYLIHAYDNPPLASQALDVARGYDRIAPEVPHALHMPTHIFTRLGLWSESASWNIRSREAARKLIVDNAIYQEFAHASDYLTYAYLQAGRDADARKARETLFAAPRIQDGFIAAYGFAAVATRIEMELGDWKAAAGIEPRLPATIDWDKYPSCEAIVYFARGVGAARSGQLDHARAALDTLDSLAQKLETQGATYWAKQTRVQQQVVQAWIHHANGKTAEALVASAAAADAEDALDKHPVTPGNVVPARELYADMLFVEKRFDDALAAYQATLVISPNRYNSLAGAARTAEELHQPAEARRYFTRLLEIAGSADTSRPGVARARTMLVSQASVD